MRMLIVASAPNDQGREQTQLPISPPCENILSADRPIYHYTTGEHFASIMQTREIRPSRRGVDPPEIPAVWLSTASEWEGSANKGVIINNLMRTATVAEMVYLCGCLIRIRINPARTWLIPPSGLKSALCVPDRIFSHLVVAGRQMGANPQDWWASALPIPASAFISVEYSVETSPIKWICCQTLTQAMIA